MDSIMSHIGHNEIGVQESASRDAGRSSCMTERSRSVSPTFESKAIDSAHRTCQWLSDRQAQDGHWRGALQGDTILESEYLLILAWAGKLHGPKVLGATARILKEQLPAGGWAIHPGGPPDVSASVKAYFALKLTGHDPHCDAMRSARTAIAACGGVPAVNSFTRFYLALLGQIPYSACPAVPPEMVLLPDWFPINLHCVSAWSRTMIVPLSLIWAFKPLRMVPADFGIGDLFSGDDQRRASVPGGQARGWGTFFRVVDRCIKACDWIGLRPLRARAIAECRRWMLERFEGSDGLGAIFPPIVWSIVALRAMGCADESPEVQECWNQLNELVEVEKDGCTRVEPCRSPVWDTAISLRAMSDAMSAGISIGFADLERAVEWLLDREIRTVGDWSHRTKAEPSGWCFEYSNRFYPDVDDTAMVLIGLAAWRRAAIVSLTGQLIDLELLQRVEKAMQRGKHWLKAMQNSDGGWGAFDRDNNMELLCKVPFADHNAMIDPSSPDLAGRVLEAFGAIGMRSCDGDPSIDRAIKYLRTTQEANGCWYGRWGVNYIYGTWQSIEGLRSVGVSVEDSAIVRGADWLASCQQDAGGWGESPLSYADPTWAGCGDLTASQTAWALSGLLSAGRIDSPEVRRGVRWLLSEQLQDGSWEEQAFTGTGFPKVFYLRYHYYPIYFPLISIVKWSCEMEKERVGHSRLGYVA